MSKSDVVFSGLVRNIEPLRKSIEAFRPLREDGIIDRMIVSTWSNQESKELTDLIEENEATLVLVPEPVDRGTGNIWCQMRSFQNGLDLCDRSNFVLKARTDFWLDPNFVRKIMEYKEDYLGEVDGHLFERKIWVPWIEITKPFYVADEFFYGTHSDVRKLINFDSEYDVKIKNIGHGITHIRRFVDPFLGTYPVLFEYLARDDSFIKLGIEGRFEALGELVEDDEYLRYLSIYYHIFNKYFRISLDNGVMNTNQPYCEPRIRLNKDEFRPNFDQKMSFFATRIFCYDDDWIRMLLAREFDSDPMAEKINDHMEEWEGNENRFVPVRVDRRI